VQRRAALGRRLASVWQPLLKRKLFWGLLGAILLLSLLPALLLTDAQAGSFVSRIATLLQYQAWPSFYFLEGSPFSASEATAATLWDFLLIPVYLTLFALLIVHARRHLLYSPQSQGARRSDAWFSRWPLILLVLADIAENVCVLFGVGAHGQERARWALLLTLSSGVKLSSLAAIVLYALSIRAFAWRRKDAAAPHTAEA
jgi:hypothetical protein